MSSDLDIWHVNSSWPHVGQIWSQGCGSEVGHRVFLFPLWLHVMRCRIIHSESDIKHCWSGSVRLRRQGGEEGKKGRKRSPSHQFCAFFTFLIQEQTKKRDDSRRRWTKWRHLRGSNCAVNLYASYYWPVCGPGRQSVRCVCVRVCVCVCVCLSVWTITCKRNDLWPRYSARWYILTPFTSYSTVKVKCQSSRSQEERTLLRSVQPRVRAFLVLSCCPVGRWRVEKSSAANNST